MKITKYFSVLVLVLLSALLTTFTLAYWAGEIRGAEITLNDDANTVTIGTAGEVVTTINVNSQNDLSAVKLVPQGRVRNNNEVDHVTLNFNVKWEDATKATRGETVKGTLKAIPKLSILQSSNHTDLFKVDVKYSNETLTLNDTVGTDVEVTVTFVKEPETKEVYDRIVSEILQLELALSVEANN